MARVATIVTALAVETVRALLTTALLLEVVTVATEVSHPAKEIQLCMTEPVTKVVPVGGHT